MIKELLDIEKQNIVHVYVSKMVEFTDDIMNL